MTIKEAQMFAVQNLVQAGIEEAEAITEARLLAIYALRTTREKLLLEQDRSLSEDEQFSYLWAVQERTRRKPLAYIVGKREFYGLPFTVTPQVLIPRPETEFVVEAILQYIKDKPDAKVVDVGTGSGAIAIAVARNAPRSHVWATDLSQDALYQAAKNACGLKVESQVTLLRGDLLKPVVPFAPFDVIASNPPYIPADEVRTLEPEVREWEPLIALGVHKSGLHFYRRLAKEAPALLAPSGLLVVEVGQGQAEAVAELWTQAGLTDVTITPDLAGIGRVVSGLRAIPVPKP